MKNKKQQIFETAALLFKENGYKATSMRELATAVHLEPSSLYSHLKSKEEILVKICFDTADLFTVGMQQIQCKNSPAKEKISELIELHFNISVNHPSSTTVFNDEWRNLNDKNLAEFLKLRKNYEFAFEKIIQQGIDEKTIIHKEPKIILHTILAMVNSIQSLPKSKSKSMLIDLKEILLNAIILNN